MIIKESSDFVNSSSNLETIQFGIREEDTGKILGILRSKMYEDPIAAICREVACNSRDANREVGKAKTPIEIEIRDSWLFTESQPVIIFKDNGPGISKHRMGDIFCHYGASTKTDTNKQTGGFGLGAKTPFSYTDLFFVETNVDGMNYIYSAALNSSGTGEMILVSEKETSESNGTKIIIPLESKDIDKFRSTVIKVCKYWEVQPILIGFKYYQFEEVTYQEKLENLCWISSERNNSNSIVILIDGIEYRIESDRLRDLGIDSGKLFSKIYIFPFKNGELSISANRETLYLDDHTVRKIKSRIKKVNEYVVKSFDDKMASATSKLDAYKIWYKIYKSSSIFDALGVKNHIQSIRKYKGQTLIDLTQCLDPFFKSELIRVFSAEPFNVRRLKDNESRVGGGIYHLLEGDKTIIIKDSRLNPRTNATIIDKFNDNFVFIAKDWMVGMHPRDIKRVEVALKYYDIKVLNYSEIEKKEIVKTKAEKIKVNKMEMLTAMISQDSNYFQSSTLLFDKNQNRIRSSKSGLRMNYVYEVIGEDYPRINSWYSKSISNITSENYNLGYKIYILNRLKSEHGFNIVMIRPADLHKFESSTNAIHIDSIVKSKEFIEEHSKCEIIKSTKTEISKCKDSITYLIDSLPSLEKIKNMKYHFETFSSTFLNLYLSRSNLNLPVLDLQEKEYSKFKKLSKILEKMQELTEFRVLASAFRQSGRWNEDEYDFISNRIENMKSLFII